MVFWCNFVELILDLKKRHLCISGHEKASNSVARVGFSSQNKRDDARINVHT